MKVTRIRLRSVGSKDVVAVPAAAALGNDGVAAGERVVVVISAPRSVFTHARARAEDKHREVGRRRVDGKGNRWIGILCRTQNEFGIALQPQIKFISLCSSRVPCHGLLCLLLAWRV